MAYRHVPDIIKQLKQANVVAVVQFRIHIFEQVVLDHDPAGMAHKCAIDLILAENIDAAGDVLQMIISDLHVLHHGPGHRARFRANSQNDRVILRMRPGVLKHISLDTNALRIFEFEKVLHHPGPSVFRAAESGMSASPAGVFIEVVLNNLDIRGKGRLGWGRAASEHHVFAGRLQIVVSNQVRPSRATQYCLRI